MSDQVMDFEVRDNVAWITFNRPEAFNAINSQATSDARDDIHAFVLPRSPARALSVLQAA